MSRDSFSQFSEIKTKVGDLQNNSLHLQCSLQTMATMEEEEEEERLCTTPEQCFYASFKIYLGDSRKNSVCESEESGMLILQMRSAGLSFSLDSVQSEVVRIVKTVEVSDECPSEDDKTLSNSGDLLVNKNDDRDDTDIEYEEIETLGHAAVTTVSPKLVIAADQDRILKRMICSIKQII